MGKLSVSVVMPTYNGAVNIIEQMDSIRKQTYPVAEVLMFDDGSTDGTVGIIQEYIEKFSLKHWKVRENSKNLGWRENFFQAIYSATSDLIFTSDQDDIWYEDKVERMTNFFSENASVNVLVSDYDELIEPGGVSYPVTDRKISNLSDRGRINFDKNNLFLNRPGWVYAVRRIFLPEIKLYQKNAIVPVHDISLWSAAVLTDSLYYLPVRTGQWRKHGNSAIRRENEIDDKKQRQQIRLDKLQRRWEVTTSDIEYLKSTKQPVADKENKLEDMRQLVREFNSRKAIISNNSMFQLIRGLSKYTALHPILADARFIILNTFK